MMSMRVKELDKEFTKKGDIFTQIEKSDNYYIYKRDMGECVYYEVFERKITKLNDFWRQYDTKVNMMDLIFSSHIQTTNNLEVGHIVVVL